MTTDDEIDHAHPDGNDDSAPRKLVRFVEHAAPLDDTGGAS